MKLLSAFLGMAALFSACVTSTRPHDADQPALSWDVACRSQDLQGMNSWVILTCTMTNRTSQPLTLNAIETVTSEKEAWRQPDPEELQVLQRDLKSRKTSKSLPLMMNGGDRLEGFLAQMLVVSGLWLTQSVKDPVQLPEKTSRTLDVKPGESVRQAFVLYKDALEAPAFVTLVSADGRFRKQVNFTPDARQRVPVEPGRGI